MKSLVIIVTGLFSFFLFDISLFRRQRREIVVHATIEIELSNHKEKLRRTQRKYKNRKYKKRESFPTKRFKYSKTTPKDSRFSNQKSLRRMYRNV